MLIFLDESIWTMYFYNAFLNYLGKRKYLLSNMSCFFVCLLYLLYFCVIPNVIEGLLLILYWEVTSGSPCGPGDAMAWIWVSYPHAMCSVHLAILLLPKILQFIYFSWVFSINLVLGGKTYMLSSFILGCFQENILYLIYTCIYVH